MRLIAEQIPALYRARAVVGGLSKRTLASTTSPLEKEKEAEPGTVRQASHVTLFPNRHDNHENEAN
jgi:hypothetical protein